MILELANDFYNLVFPPVCSMCSNLLLKDEQSICLPCRMDLPRTDFHTYKDNPVFQTFAGRLPLRSATSYLFMRKGSHVQSLLHSIKYQNAQHSAWLMGRSLYRDVAKGSDFFSSIDHLVPVPLHQRKLKARGYNQALRICEGIKAGSSIPISNLLNRVSHSESQTGKNRLERWLDIQDSFSASKPLGKKHILLVDDVITTGATLEACAIAILKASPQTKISLASLAFAS